MIVLKAEPMCISWEKIVLCIVMTATFVRHSADGNRSLECIKALFDGLLELMKVYITKIPELGGWVRLFIK